MKLRPHGGKVANRGVEQPVSTARCDSGSDGVRKAERPEPLVHHIGGPLMEWVLGHAAGWSGRGRRRQVGMVHLPG